MGSFLSDTFFKSFLSTENMFISIFMIQILHNFTNSSIFINIGRNCLLGNRKKIAKFLMRTFTSHSTFLYGRGEVRGESWEGEIGGQSPYKEDGWLKRDNFTRFLKWRKLLTGFNHLIIIIINELFSCVYII
jgi:hypothetical protein